MTNFSEYVFQQIQKYHTTPSDTLILIFSSIVALATLVLIGLTISEKTPPNLLIPLANMVILIILLAIIIYVGWRIPKTNNRIQQIEHAIIQNQNVIDVFSIQRRERILLLIEEVLTKTKSSKETEGMNRDDKFNELMSYLNEKFETELKQIELKPNLSDNAHKLTNRCSLRKINFRDPLITNIAIVVLTAIVAGFVIYEYYLDNFPPVINTEGGDIYLNLGTFPGFVMPKGIMINPIGPHFLRFTVTDVKLLDLNGQYAKCFFAESPNVTLWRPSSIILNKDGDLKQLDPDLIIAYRANPNFQFSTNNETRLGLVQLGDVMFYLNAQDLQETQKTYPIEVPAPLIAKLPPNLYHFITNNCKY